MKWFVACTGICLLFAIIPTVTPGQEPTPSSRTARKPPQRMPQNNDAHSGGENILQITRQQKEGWFYISSDDLFDYFHNPKTAIKAADKMISIWIKTMPAPGVSRVDILQNLEHGREGFSLSKYGKYAYTLRHETYDCKNKKRQLLEILDYDASGIVIYAITCKLTWEELVPDSVDHSLLLKICH